VKLLDGAPRLPFVAGSDSVNNFIRYYNARRQDDLTPSPAAFQPTLKPRTLGIAIDDFVQYVCVEIRDDR